MGLAALVLCLGHTKSYSNRLGISTEKAVYYVSLHWPILLLPPLLLLLWTQRPRSHQTFRPVLAVVSWLGIMWRNRCCPTTFHNWRCRRMVSSVINSTYFDHTKLSVRFHPWNWCWGLWWEINVGPLFFTLSQLTWEVDRWCQVWSTPHILITPNFPSGSNRGIVVGDYVEK